MKLKNTKTKRFYYEYNELDSLAEFLEEQALEGWELTNKTGGMLGFRRCEPRNVKISAELVNNMGDDSERLKFVSYCKAAGWRHIYNDGKIQIFENEDMDADPINTDPATKLAAIHRKCLVSKVLLGAVILGVFIFAILKLIRYDEYNMYLSTVSILSGFVLPMYAVITLIMPIDYFIWYHKARKLVRAGLEPEYKKRLVTRVANGVGFAAIFGGLWGGNILDAIYMNNKVLLFFGIALYAIILISITGFEVYQARYNTSRKGTGLKYAGWGIIIGILVLIASFFVGAWAEPISKGEPIITLNDLGVETTAEHTDPLPEDLYVSTGGTFMLGEYFGSDDSPNPMNYRVSYEAYSTSNHRIYEMVVNQRFLNHEAYNFKQIDAPSFGANKVYYDEKSREYLLLYDKIIVNLDTNVPLSYEQAEAISKKFS